MTPIDGTRARRGGQSTERQEDERGRENVGTAGEQMTPTKDSITSSASKLESISGSQK